MVKSNSYNNWISHFPKHELADIEYWEDLGVDFQLPIKIYYKFVCLEKVDVENLTKSATDMIFGRVMLIDDNCIDQIDVERIGTCNSYDDGKIYYYIENCL